MKGYLVTPAMHEDARTEKACGWLEFPCEEFLLLTTQNAFRWKVDEAPDTLPLEQYNQFVKDGKTRIIPFLDVDIHSGKVVGHEGRHRALACIKAGVHTMPVAIFLREKGSKVYYTQDYDTWEKTYKTLADVPEVLHGQFNGTGVRVNDKWKRDSYWAAWNKTATTARVRVASSGPIVIGLGWDEYTPRVEAAIMMDCMQLQGLRPNQELYALVDPAMTDDSRMLVGKLLSRIGVQVIEGKRDLVYFKSYIQTSDSKYIPDYEVVGSAKQFRQIMTPRKATNHMTQRTNYPSFPVVERPAPPATLPQYMTRPPQSPHSLQNLPRWAWNHF